ncbi:MAG: 5'-methylthioadenosine/S-adenosylhomocysteine nucleosidase [Gammaproteobacteria bacterium]|nr:5'-methylthioadenosine/S-adenosylhomocysteine nucleosidase [Gammaproteobacteria bacterium]
MCQAEDIADFLAEHADSQWTQLSESAKAFVTSVSIKLEPIQDIGDKKTEHAIVGFEMLALGPGRENFGQLVARCEELEVDPQLLRAALFIAALQTAKRLKDRWRKAGMGNADSKVFSVNVDGELIAEEDRILRPALKRFAPAGLMLEAHEKISSTAAKRLLALVSDLANLQLQLALDDSDELDRSDDGRMVRRILRPRIDFSKVDFKRTRDLMEPIRDRDTIEEFKRYAVKDKPLVIEGIGYPKYRDFLENNWKADDGEYWIQGYLVQVGPEFEATLEPLSTDPRCPQGYVEKRRAVPENGGNSLQPVPSRDQTATQVSTTESTLDRSPVADAIHPQIAESLTATEAGSHDAPVAEAPPPMVDTASIPPPTGSERVLLLVYVNVAERDAVMSGVTGASPTLNGDSDVPHADFGVVNGYRVVAVQSAAGSSSPGGAATTVSDAIREFKPAQVIAVGVACGLNKAKQQLGDILVSSAVWTYEFKRIGAKGSVDRNFRYAASEALCKRFFQAGAPDFWNGAALHFGILLSGEKLMDSDPRIEELKMEWPDAEGLEMEGAGLAAVAHGKGVPWLICKGISDWGDGNKRENKAALQKTAAENAVAFVRHVLFGGQGRDARVLDPLPATSTTGVAEEPAPSSASPIHERGIPAIKKLLDGQSELARRLREAMGQETAENSDIAEWLVPRSAEIDDRMTTLFDKASEWFEDMPSAEGHQQRCAALRKLLGWMAVCAVIDGAQDPDGRMFEGWADEGRVDLSVDTPLGAEILAACWNKREMSVRFEIVADIRGGRHTTRDTLGSPDVEEFEKPGERDYQDLYGHYFREAWYAMFGARDERRVDDTFRQLVKTHLRKRLTGERPEVLTIVVDERAKHVLLDRAARDQVRKALEHVRIVHIGGVDAGGTNPFVLTDAELSAGIGRVAALLHDQGCDSD